MLRWGATAEEASEPLPADDRTPHPRVQSTRAVTIDVPPEQVWPWLLQLGTGRAGFYSHDWVRTAHRPRPVRRGQALGHTHPLRDTTPAGRRHSPDGRGRVC